MTAFPYRILVEWSDADESFVARVPALNLATHGDSAEEATREAEVAAGLALDVLREDGTAAPEPDAAADYAGKVALRMSRSMHARVARLAQAEDVSINQLLVSIIAEGLARSSGRSPTPRKRTTSRTSNR
jgi:predicted RNase H-like HicB family nuclease